MIPLGLIVLFLLWCITGVAGWLVGGQVVWLWFYGLALLTMYVALHYVAIRVCHIERHVVADRYCAGDAAKMRVQLTLKTWLPLLWIAIEEPWTRFGRDYTVQRTMRLVGFRTTCTYSYTLPSLPRGEYVAKEVRISFGDVLGFCQYHIAVDDDVHLTVFPQADEIRYRTVAKSRSYGGEELQGVRNYQLGDPLSHIHWKASTFTDRWKTKQWATEQVRRLLIALDVTQLRSNEACMERAIEVAAGYAQAAYHQNVDIGIACGGGRAELPIARHSQEVIDHALAILDPAGVSDQGGSYEWLDRSLQARPRDSKLCLISTFASAELWEVIACAIKSGALQQSAIQVIHIAEDRNSATVQQVKQQCIQLGCALDVIEAAQHARHVSEESEEGVDQVGA